MRKFLTTLFENLAEKLREKDSHITIPESKDIDIGNKPKAKKSLRKRSPKVQKNTAIKAEIKEAFPEISDQKMKLICAAGDIRLDPDKTESAFMARQLVQATLPHKNPGNIPVWARTNGGLTVSIQPGIDNKQEVTGYPYGTIPRLLLFWLTTEAIRTNSPRIELGNNLAHFMETLGLNPRMGGKRSDVKRLQDQMQRLFYSRISFNQTTKGRGESWLNMQVTSKGMLWWDAKQPSQPTLWENWIQIGEEFFKAITTSPVPVDMRALKALKKSPLALDIYAWATYTAYQTQKNGQSRSISWEILHQQFGAEYKDTYEFSRKAWNALKKVQSVYPELGIERVKGGIMVLPSKPSITIKQKKSKS
jgi:Plasmid encoded RepA protein.